MTLNHNCGCFSGVGGIAGNLFICATNVLQNAETSNKIELLKIIKK